jgi:hypothetical protein
VFCEGYLAMLELEEINESCESGSEIYECKFFWIHLYIQPGQEEEDGTKSIGFMEGEETVHWTNNTDF